MTDASTLTDVNDVSVLVDHDIAVVSVFDLQQKADHAVCSHAFDEFGACLLEFARRLFAIRLQKVIIQ